MSLSSYLHILESILHKQFQRQVHLSSVLTQKRRQVDINSIKLRDQTLLEINQKLREFSNEREPNGSYTIKLTENINTQIQQFWESSVSYTHLTLPTICSVQISVVAVSLKKKNKKQSQEDSYKQTIDKKYRQT
eukprot:TRINITY_DN27906_c0_g1_i2.p2 TRINITY_DN27906_c0_g1~~TRINITY_DN27906_c0_g1_i2.p2  ORF type:complete len:134 (-),score=21.89 TRINITY_DN27906_c0_g1_i2:42-443(-)